MKKFTLAAMVLGVALLFAVPAMAVDVALDGYMRASGYLEKAYSGNDTQDSYNAYYDFRWRVNSTVTVSDTLRMRSRTRIFNTVWGSGNDGGGESGNIEFERAWMVITTPYGLLEVGKQLTAAFGTAFADSEADAWRIKYTGKFGPLTTVGVIQKNVERDGGSGTLADYNNSDADNDLYAIALVYPQENWTLGSLQVFIRDDAAGPDTREQFVVDPFFTGKFGNLSLQAEFRADLGNTAAGGDYKGYAFNAEGTYDLGPAAVQLGFAYVTGDDDPTDDDLENGVVGADWEKMYILFGTTGNAGNPGVLYGVGNFASGSGNDDGFWSVYGGADTNLTEKLNVGLMVAYAEALEAPGGISDDAGVEVDVRATWNIYDNLTYTVIGAVLFTGDYYKDYADAQFGGDSNDDAAWSIFHRLQLNF